MVKIRKDLESIIGSIRDAHKTDAESAVDVDLVDTLKSASIIINLCEIASHGKYVLCACNLPCKENKDETTDSSHTHNFQWQTITAPTKDTDGLEGEVCSCGAVKNTQPLSAYGYALNDYAPPMINAAKSGQTITFEFGEWNSFPKSLMAKLVDKSAQTISKKLSDKGITQSMSRKGN